MRIEQSPEFQIHLQTLKSKEQIFLETIYNVGNGHFGVRDSNPLQGNNPDYIGSPGLFINGFFDYKEVSYGEKYRGYPDNNQVINRLFDSRAIRIKVGSEDSLTNHFKVENIDKNLDMQTGLLHELFSVTTPENRNFNLVVESFASLSKTNVFGVKYSIIPTNFSDEVEIIKVHDYVNQKVHQQDDDIRVSTDLGQMQLDFIPDNGQPSYLVTTFRSQQGAIITLRLLKTSSQILQLNISEIVTIIMATGVSILPNPVVPKSLNFYLLLAIFIHWLTPICTPTNTFPHWTTTSWIRRSNLN
ncbi:hypothetical protein [Lentilactobacillus kefiri]|uniref:hypothetical protein n=1 Tax=Lentilactobacillus kefiri TaxID=33962 RepID=UPI00345E28FC